MRSPTGIGDRRGRHDHCQEKVVIESGPGVTEQQLPHPASGPTERAVEAGDQAKRAGDADQMLWAAPGDGRTSRYRDKCDLERGDPVEMRAADTDLVTHLRMLWLGRSRFRRQAEAR